MAKSRSYVSDLIESLRDPVEAAEYLNAALEDGEPEVFLIALKDVVDSLGGMSKLAETISLNRENLYRMLSSKGNPEFFSLCSVLDALGFRLAVEPKIASKNSLVLHTFVDQVRELPEKYALAADPGSNEASEVKVRTADDKEIGLLVFDYKQGRLSQRQELIFSLRHCVCPENEAQQRELLRTDFHCCGCNSRYMKNFALTFRDAGFVKCSRHATIHIR